MCTFTNAINFTYHKKKKNHQINIKQRDIIKLESLLPPYWDQNL
jgi:hypothetical protein